MKCDAFHMKNVVLFMKSTAFHEKRCTFHEMWCFSYEKHCAFHEMWCFSWKAVLFVKSVALFIWKAPEIIKNSWFNTHLPFGSGWFMRWEYPNKAKEKHMKSVRKAYEKRRFSKDHLQGIVTLCSGFLGACLCIRLVSYFVLLCFADLLLTWYWGLMMSFASSILVTIDLITGLHIPRFWQTAFYKFNRSPLPIKLHPIYVQSRLHFASCLLFTCYHEQHSNVM